MPQARILGRARQHDPRPRRLYRARRQCSLSARRRRSPCPMRCRPIISSVARRHQQGAGDADARRRPAAGRLRHGAAARPGGARTRARPRRGAPAQSRAGRRDAAHDAAGDPRRHRGGARQRRLSGLPGGGARRAPAGPIFRARQRAARAAGPLYRHGPCQFRRGHRARAVRAGDACASARRGKVHVYTGAAAMGQGTKTMLAQIVAEELGGDMAQHHGDGRRYRRRSRWASAASTAGRR